MSNVESNHDFELYIISSYLPTKFPYDISTVSSYGCRCRTISFVYTREQNHVKVIASFDGSFSVFTIFLSFFFFFSKKEVVGPATISLSLRLSRHLCLFLFFLPRSKQQSRKKNLAKVNKKNDSVHFLFAISSFIQIIFVKHVPEN